MSGIRLANIPDIDEICKLSSEFLAQSVYKDIPPDESKYRLFVAGLMGMKKGAVWVAVDDDDKPQGFLLGLVDTFFFSKYRYGTDVAVYVRDGYRHMAPRLFNEFMAWAAAKPRVKHITLGTSSGLGNADRVCKTYSRRGLQS